VVFGGDFTGSVTHLGTSGNDTLTGTSANETLVGAQGNDTLTGGTGADRLTGGSGSDIFAFNANDSTAATTDVVTDFITAIDKINFSGMSGINYDPTTPAVFGTDVTATINTINTAGADNRVHFFTNGTDGYLYVKDSDNSSGFGGNLIKLAGVTAAPVFSDLVGVAAVASSSPTEGNDTLIGTSGSDYINLLGGDDFYCGEGGSDIISAGAGNDTIDGGAGDEYINGDIGNDALVGSAGNDFILGGEGNDSINGGNDNDTIRGGAGVDNLTGGSGADLFVYTSGSESMDTAADTINDFQTGVDKLHFTLAGSYIDVSSFASVGTYNGGQATLSGQIGDGFYASFDARLYIDATGNGSVTDATDYVIASTSPIAATDLEFDLTGTAGVDTIIGSAGNDNIITGSSNDTISGGAGNDIIDGGGGIDTLTGGDGNDIFKYVSLNDCGDIISDFNTSFDFFVFDGTIFAGDANNDGNLDVGAFASGAGLTAAADADTRFIFDTTDSKLYYDADGASGEGSVLVAEANATVTQTDIHIAPPP
jgi:Ca2+-binding RTX toxin-like protein